MAGVKPKVIAVHSCGVTVFAAVTVHCVVMFVGRVPVPVIMQAIAVVAPVTVTVAWLVQPSEISEPPIEGVVALSMAAGTTAHPVALPKAVIPVGADPAAQVVGVVASAVAVAAFPVVL